MFLALSGTALAQQTDSAPPKPTRAQLARARAAAGREAEKFRRRLDFIDAATLKSEADLWLGPGKSLGKTLLSSGDDRTFYVLVRRTASSRPEVHARWDDLVLVRSGSGAIVLGDSLLGSRYRAPGERDGGEFVGRNQIVVHAGDLVRIPAAVPHAFVVSGTEPLEYLVIKQRRPDLPLRWTAP